jgi:hypothetical protein
LNTEGKRFQVAQFADAKTIKESLHSIVGNINGLSQVATLQLAKRIDHATLRIADWAAANALAGGDFTQGDLLQFNDAVCLLVDVAELKRDEAIKTLISKKPKLAAIAAYFSDCTKGETVLDYTGDLLPEPSWYSGKEETEA